MFIIICSVLILVCILNTVLLFRNFAVYKYRIDRLNKMMEIIDSGDLEKSQKLLSEFERVSYDKMVWLFWKPLKSFFKLEI